MAIPANARAKSTIESKMTFILKFMNIYSGKPGIAEYKRMVNFRVKGKIKSLKDNVAG